MKLQTQLTISRVIFVALGGLYIGLAVVRLPDPLAVLLLIVGLACLNYARILPGDRRTRWSAFLSVAIAFALENLITGLLDHDNVGIVVGALWAAYAGWHAREWPVVEADERADFWQQMCRRRSADSMRCLKGWGEALGEVRRLRDRCEFYERCADHYGWPRADEPETQRASASYDRGTRPALPPALEEH
jgi:hypothetical protein